MADTGYCEYCERPLKSPPVIKKLRGKKHVFCTEFCFRLSFYDVPRITYKDLKKMYKLRCVTVNAPDFRTLVVESDAP
ncbi:MAG: hypothetical protein A2Y92_03080 [Chloroflexi bacterium RBG_13_57_8]|nr:MAG: hypothetical protein A2Y92_03080 [Chloroflexi bacterium RBG_13_57_8]